jgi:rubrerythrin
MKFLRTVESIVSNLVRFVDELADAVTRSGRCCSPVDTEAFTKKINERRHSGLTIEASRDLHAQKRNTREGWIHCRVCGVAFEGDESWKYCSHACSSDFARSCD